MKRNFLALMLLFVLSLSYMSCEPTDINDDTQTAQDVQSTDPGDSTNSGSNPPPPPPDNGED